MDASDNMMTDIVIFDSFWGCDTFDRHETLKLRGHTRCYSGDCFWIYLDINDDEGREIKGGVSYDFHSVEMFYNRRICSIIRGKHGYAALHYILVGDAVQAELGFNLESAIPNANLKVHGKISARYSNFRYSTQYQKKYYQKVLFEKGESDGVDFGELPLSHSVIGVPLNASLIVLAKLHVILDGDRIETLQYEQKFNPPSPEQMESVLRPCSTSSDAVKCQNFHFQLSVKWTSL